MQYKANGVVTGFTKFQGVIDGQAIDANTVFVEIGIGDMGKGTRTVARKCKDEAVIKRIEHNSFPFEAEVTMEEIATAKREQLVVTDIKPLRQIPQQPKAA